MQSSKEKLRWKKKEGDRDGSMEGGRKDEFGVKNGGKIGDKSRRRKERVGIQIKKGRKEETREGGRIEREIQNKKGSIGREKDINKKIARNQTWKKGKKTQNKKK